MSTTQSRQHAKRKFKVEISISGSFFIHVLGQSYLDDDFDVETITSEDAYDKYQGAGKPILINGFGSPNCYNDNDLDFNLKVYDENDSEVFESKNYRDFQFIYDFDVDFGKNNREELQRHLDLSGLIRSFGFGKRIQDLDGLYGRGACVAKGDYDRIFLVEEEYEDYRVATFSVEDDKFDPKKLVFVENPAVKALPYESMTDFKHIFYYDSFVEIAKDEEYCDFDGSDMYLYESDPDKPGQWKCIRKL